jgi:two-component system LytT family response regulator
MATKQALRDSVGGPGRVIPHRAPLASAEAGATVEGSLATARGPFRCSHRRCLATGLPYGLLEAAELTMHSNRKLRAIIVEDEEGPRQLLKRLLARRHSDVIEVVGEAETGPAALMLCEEQQPDVLFLDLHLPGFDGFDLLSQLRSETHVVITTGDTQQAVEAYRANAVDYLLKPVDPEQLRDAVARVASAIASEKIVRILCRDRDATKVVHIDDILSIQADEGYTSIQTDGPSYLLNDSLAALVERLPNHFIRVHRTTIVNVRHVTELSKGNDFVYLGKKRHEISISRRHLREFRRRLIYEE